MGIEKDRFTRMNDPSGRTCHCGGPVTCQELPSYYENGGFCSDCDYQRNKDDL